MEEAGQEGWGLEGLLGSRFCSGAPSLVELGLRRSGGCLIPACRDVDFRPPHLLEADQLTGKMETVTFYECLSLHTIASCFPAS